MTQVVTVVALRMVEAEVEGRKILELSSSLVLMLATPTPAFSSLVAVSKTGSSERAI